MGRWLAGQSCTSSRQSPQGCLHDPLGHGRGGTLGEAGPRSHMPASQHAPSQRAALARSLSLFMVNCHETMLPQGQMRSSFCSSSSSEYGTSGGCPSGGPQNAAAQARSGSRACTRRVPMPCNSLAPNTTHLLPAVMAAKASGAAAEAWASAAAVSAWDAAAAESVAWDAAGEAWASAAAVSAWDAGAEAWALAAAVSAWDAAAAVSVAWGAAVEAWTLAEAVVDAAEEAFLVVEAWGVAAAAWAWDVVAAAWVAVAWVAAALAVGALVEAEGCEEVAKGPNREGVGMSGAAAEDRHQAAGGRRGAVADRHQVSAGRGGAVEGRHQEAAAMGEVEREGWHQVAAECRGAGMRCLAVAAWQLPGRAQEAAGKEAGDPGREVTGQAAPAAAAGCLHPAVRAAEPPARARVGAARKAAAGCWNPAVGAVLPRLGLAPVVAGREVGGPVLGVAGREARGVQEEARRAAVAGREG